MKSVRKIKCKFDGIHSNIQHFKRLKTSFLIYQFLILIAYSSICVELVHDLWYIPNYRIYIIHHMYKQIIWFENINHFKPI